MENNAVGVLSSLLKIDKDVLSEKLQSEEGVKEITETANNLKVYTNEGFIEVTDNLRKTYKDGVYKEIKGATLEMQEKELKEKFPNLAQLKRGTDYNSLQDLIGKVVETATPITTNDDELKAKIELLQNGLTERSTQWEQDREQLINSHLNELVTSLTNTEVSKLKSVVDIDETIVDGQLELFKAVLNSKYEVKRDENKEFYVLDKSTGKAVTNTTTYANESYANVVNNEAKNFFKFKSVAPKIGRGSETQIQNPVGNIVNWAKYDNNFDTFLNSNDGKGFRAGTMETQLLFEKFLTETKN